MTTILKGAKFEKKEPETVRQLASYWIYDEVAPK